MTRSAIELSWTAKKCYKYIVVQFGTEIAKKRKPVETWCDKVLTLSNLGCLFQFQRLFHHKSSLFSHVLRANCITITITLSSTETTRQCLQSTYLKAISEVCTLQRWIYIFQVWAAFNLRSRSRWHPQFPKGHEGIPKHHLQPFNWLIKISSRTVSHTNSHFFTKSWYFL